jgi:hypothetical protein
MRHVEADAFVWWAMPDDLAVPLDTTGEPAGIGGVLGAFRRWGAGNGSAAISSMIEELFGPTKHQARIEVEAQRSLARPVPAPTDPPPDLPEPGAEAPDRRRGRFTGIVVIRRR